MAPPLLNEYKIKFAFNRIIGTISGGPAISWSYFLIIVPQNNLLQGLVGGAISSIALFSPLILANVFRFIGSGMISLLFAGLERAFLI